MGLALSVGILQELRGDDSEGYETYRSLFNQLNTDLERRGLPAHHEPNEIAPEHCISFDMFGYSGLHYLRRIAAHINYTSVLPPPGDKDSDADPLLQKYYSETNVKWLATPARTLRKLKLFLRNQSLSKALRFDHLIDHSDCESFYVPIRFNEVFAASARIGCRMATNWVVIQAA